MQRTRQFYKIPLLGHHTAAPHFWNVLISSCHALHIHIISIWVRFGRAPVYLWRVEQKFQSLWQSIRGVKTRSAGDLKASSEINEHPDTRSQALPKRGIYYGLTMWEIDGPSRRRRRWKLGRRNWILTNQIRNFVFIPTIFHGLPSIQGLPVNSNLSLLDFWIGLSQ